MTVQTKSHLLASAKQLFARDGYEGFSVRTLAAVSEVQVSSIYHFFRDKDNLLHEVFALTNRELGLKRLRLPERATAREMLLDRIEFQFRHMEDVVFVLKYYVHFRQNFPKLENGYIPVKGYLHIEEVLIHGLATGEFGFDPRRLADEAKVTTHAINGFLLEYYPAELPESELQRVIQPIHRFLMRSLTNKEVDM